MDQFDWPSFAHNTHADDSFSAHPPSPEMKKCVKELRKMAREADETTTTIEEFFEAAGPITRKALWADVQHAIACSGGPELPELIWLKNGKRKPFVDAWILPPISKVKDDNNTVFMLLTVALCFEARGAFLCKGLLKSHSNWWLRLLMWDEIYELNAPEIAAAYD